MTSPDYAETVRLLPADTFTQQTRAEWIGVVVEALLEADGERWHPGVGTVVVTAVDALLAHLATQQPRPMPGGDGQ